jgi:Calcineurin-like phosphoesterase
MKPRPKTREAGDERVAPLGTRERRLRRGLIGLSMFAAFLLLLIAAIVFYWRLYVVGPEGSPFTRGPYLLRVTESAADLRWKTDGDQTVEVTAIGPEGRTISAREGRLTGLRPGTRYAWTASVGGGGRASGNFVTPTPDPARPVRFSVLADYGDGSEPQWAVARTIAAARPDFVLTAGDNSYLNAAEILLDRNIFRPMAEVMRSAPVYVGLGDHDLLPPGDEAIRAAFDLPPGGRYVLEQGRIQVVVLADNTGDGGTDYARRALARGDFDRRFVVVHKPLRAGNPILPVLKRAGVDAVFSGNLHLYERRMVEGVQTFTVGTGGVGIGSQEFTPRSRDAQKVIEDFGHLQVDVSPTGVRYSFIDQRGRVLDRAVTP